MTKSYDRFFVSNLYLLNFGHSLRLKFCFSSGKKKGDFGWVQLLSLVLVFEVKL